VVMRLFAIGATLDQEFAALGRFPICAIFREIGNPDLVCHPTRSMIAVAQLCLCPRAPPVPCDIASVQLRTCTVGCASPRNWRTVSITLVMPPRCAGWLLHQPPPSVFTG